MEKAMSPIRVLAVTIHPIDSLCPIGYLKKNIFSNGVLFQIMELYSSSAYYEPSKQPGSTVESLYVQPNSCVIRASMPPEASETTVAGQTNAAMGKDLCKSVIKAFAPCVVAKSLLDRIRTFAPDVVYTEGYDIRILKLAYTISKKLSISVVTHTMDDWFSKHIVARFFQRRAFKNCAGTSGRQLAASVPMTDFLRDQFGVKSDFVGNCVDFSSPDRCARLDNNGEGLNIVFTGNLTPGRFPPIAWLADTIDADAQLRQRVKLHIYAPRVQSEACSSDAADKPQLVMEPYLSTGEIPAVLRAADILLHVESFDEADKEFTRYSLSTKIAEYLASKTPIVYFGPPDVGVAEFLSSNELAFVSDKPAEVVEYLHLLIRSGETQLAAAHDRFKRSKHFFDRQEVQRRLYSVLSEAVKSQN